MTASRILGGNSNTITNNHQHHNYDNNIFRSIPIQQFNNNAPAVFDNTYNQALPLAEYQFVPNEIIVSPTSIYKVLQFLGKGTFGQVVKCWRLSCDDKIGNSNARTAPTFPRLNRVEVVALKILRCHPSYERQAQTEAAVLGRLFREGIAGRFNMVQPYEFFRHKGHSCLVFEALDINLYEYLKCNQFRPLQLEHVRMIAQQVLVALAKLKSMGLIHADLKPENIMLVDSIQKPFRVKVVDFGSACFASNTTSTTYLQSRYYRAPEIILGLTYNESIDMWSLGCVLAELYLGWPLYPGASEYDQIRYIVQTQGMPSERLLKKANKTRQFFEQVALACSGDQRVLPKGPVETAWQFRWSLKETDAYERETGIKPKETRKYVIKSLKDLQMVGSVTPLEHNSFLELNSNKADKRCFVSLLESMLQLDSRSRITPLDALDHPFITMNHLRDLGHSRLFSRSIALMNSCVPLTRRDLDELSGGRRPRAPNVSRLANNMTASNACHMSIGTNPPSTAHFQQGFYPWNQFFIDFPQYLTQAQVPIPYLFPSVNQLPLINFHSLMVANPNPVITQENAYPLAALNVPLVISNHRHPKVVQDASPLIPVVFDSFGSSIGSVGEHGGAFRSTGTTSFPHSPRQHLNTLAPVSMSRFRRGKQVQRSKRRDGDQEALRCLLARGNNDNNSAIHQDLQAIAGDNTSQESKSIASGQLPWHRRNGSCSRRPEIREADEPRNDNNINSLGSYSNYNQRRVESNNRICQANSFESAGRNTPVHQIASGSDTQKVEDNVSASVCESTGNHKERVSQDSGIGRATLPSPNQSIVVASDSSDNSPGGASKDLHMEGGRLIDAMRNLQMPDDGPEPFSRDPNFDEDEPAPQPPIINPDADAWIEADRVERSYEETLLTHAPRRLIDCDPEAMETIRLFSENAIIPQPPAYDISTSNAARRSQMNGPNTGPGTGRHGHYPRHQVIGENVRENRHAPHMARQIPSALDHYPFRYQQQRQMQHTNQHLFHQQLPQLNQNVSQPTLLLYQPQVPQFFSNGPLYNVPANRALISQPTHPSSIILLSPEGNPSVYSLTYAGSLVTAPLQGMNCGFYALGNSVVHQPSPINPQLNPQAQHYIYQA